MLPLVLIAVSVVVASVDSACADEAATAYSRFDAKRCRHVAGRGEEDYGSWTCPGHAGLPVRLSAGDQRMFVSYGQAGPDDLAARQTFPAFNDVYAGTVEWRLRGRRPFATILRWNVMTATDIERAKGPSKASGRVLVVSRLGAGGVCHVGYVDARANPDANAMARKLADERAETFRCGQDKAGVVGAVTPGLSMP